MSEKKPFDECQYWAITVDNSWSDTPVEFVLPGGIKYGSTLEEIEKFSFELKYEKKPRVKILEEKFNAHDYEEKGLKTLGVRLSTKEVESVKVDGNQLDLW